MEGPEKEESEKFFKKKKTDVSGGRVMGDREHFQHARLSGDDVEGTGGVIADEMRGKFAGAQLRGGKKRNQP